MSSREEQIREYRRRQEELRRAAELQIAQRSAPPAPIPAASAQVSRPQTYQQAPLPAYQQAFQRQFTQQPPPFLPPPPSYPPPPQRPYPPIPNAVQPAAAGAAYDLPSFPPLPPSFPPLPPSLPPPPRPLQYSDIRCRKTFYPLSNLFGMRRRKNYKSKK